MRKSAIPGYRLTKDGKIEKDVAAQEAKLDVSTRLKRRNSTKVKFKRGGGK
jgi:hypothetical protein